MDDAAFGLNECQRVYFAAGIRHILRLPEQDVSRETSSAPSPVSLPDAYKAVLEKAVVGCTTLWTYVELGADLLGRTTPERSAFVKNLVQTLAWPKGSIGFWPYTQWLDGALVQSAEIFLLGMHRIRPKSVIVFGQESFTRCIASLPALRDLMHGGSLPVLWLDDIATFAGRRDATLHLVEMLHAHKRAFE